MPEFPLGLFRRCDNSGIFREFWALSREFGCFVEPLTGPPHYALSLVLRSRYGGHNLFWRFFLLFDIVYRYTKGLTECPYEAAARFRNRLLKLVDPRAGRVGQFSTFHSSIGLKIYMRVG